MSALKSVPSVPQSTQSARLRAALAVTSCALLAACNSGGRDDVEAGDLEAGEAGGLEAATGQLEQPIVGGDTDREHIAVLAIATITPELQALCTGTLIAPNLVLTARHCVVPVESEIVDCSSSTFPAPYSPDALWVSPSTTLRGADLFPVREVAVPEDDGALCGADIALLILDGQFSDAVEPIAPRLDSPAVRGESFTAVGFGSALDEGQAGIRRAVSGIEVVCGADQCGAPDVLTSTEFVSEQAVCEGDSGGPALDEQGRVLGVASRTGEDCTWAVYSAVTPWRDWIVDVAERAATFGRYEAPAWLAAAQSGAAPGGGPIAGATGEGNAAADGPEGSSAGGPVASATGSGDTPSVPSVDDVDLGGATPSASRADSGCALAAHPSSAPWASLGIGLGALALTLRRRRTTEP